MTRWNVGGGWALSAMAQAFPLYSSGVGGFAGTPVGEGAFYLTQSVAMLDLRSPAGRWSLRLTPNLEGVTIDEGELTAGAWGEGFVDRRHPHTLLHEAVVSVDLWDGRLSVSAGKGFAPYGTPDPMSRPGAKYPINHHLSQVPERWFVSTAWSDAGWSVEAGVFSGTEPTGPYDFDNITTSGDSWSMRVTRTLGSGLRLSASYANVLEPAEPQLNLPGFPQDDDHKRGRSHLTNVAVFQDIRMPLGRLEWLIEASRDHHGELPKLWSLLGEARLSAGAHRPYLRLEYATRPEFARFGGPGADTFFRYGFDDEFIGGNRWFIASVGYGHAVSAGRVQVQPFVEWQGIHIEDGWGGLDPRSLYGVTGGGVLTAGFRLYFGGGPMPMGSYGVLDSMRPTQHPSSARY